MNRWWAPKNKQNTSSKEQAQRRLSVGIVLAVITVVAVAIALAWLFYEIFAYEWPIASGFDEYTPPKNPDTGYQRAKTLWDWLQLLIVPLVLSIAAFFLNRTERVNAEKAAKQRDETERKIADQRADTERKIAEQRALDGILEDYLDRVTGLLVDKHLLQSSPGDEVRVAAWIRTVTAMRRLDAERNSILLQFLYDAGLLKEANNPNGSVIELKNSNLRNVKLEDCDLQGIDLSGVNLRGANLSGANLKDAILEGADLEGADLLATQLKDANCKNANFQKTNLGSAFFLRANFEGAKLEGVSLDEEDFKFAYFRGAWVDGGLYIGD